MYHNDWMLLKLAEERQRDLMRQLEHDRLIREAESTQSSARGTRCIMCWTGWGGSWSAGVNACKRGTPCIIVKR